LPRFAVTKYFFSLLFYLGRTTPTSMVFDYRDEAVPD
jgi:hypothetical protein